MKKAVLSLRVSSDEQAEKCYSLYYQENILREYCKENQIQILNIYKEDQSSLTLAPPEFEKFLFTILEAQERPNLLLFTKWDRFTTSVQNSYEMISKLKLYNIETIAILQPINFGGPEALTRLAIYLTLPEK